MTLRKEAVMRFVGSVNSKNSRPKKKTREIKFKTQFHDFLKYFLCHKSQGRSGTVGPILKKTRNLIPENGKYGRKLSLFVLKIDIHFI